MFEYFTDPVLRAPTLGSMFMCLAAALVGVIVFLRKQSLVGESLSHASYPGVILGVIAVGLLWGDVETGGTVAVFIMAGAFCTALLGLWSIHLMERYFKVHSDAALCFILSTFFGVGLTLASHVQFKFSYLYKQIQVYLFGQTATMTDIHILIYGVLSLAVFAVVVLFFKELQTMTFDRDYAKSLRMRVNWIDGLLFALIVLAVVIGIRSVGVVLMSAMLIAPAAAARQFTNKMSVMLGLAAFFGVLSGFLGNVLSFEISKAYNISMPTGPMIVVVASCICLCALLFAPERGVCIRLMRMAAFRDRCLSENILKTMWKKQAPMTLNDILRYQQVSKIYLWWILSRLNRQGWVTKTVEGYVLTGDGAHRGSQIVRLHRLWEVYLVDYIGIGVEKVHRNAEEMEHIITPELEKELILLLNDPKRDPHMQPIPPGEKL